MECWGCGQPGHIRAFCPYGPLGGQRGQGSFRYATRGRPGGVWGAARPGSAFQQAVPIFSAPALTYLPRPAANSQPAAVRATTVQKEAILTAVTEVLGGPGNEQGADQ